MIPPHRLKQVVRSTTFMQRGKVYLVGAGPGHPELLTLKAAELLRTGDVIVYDRLIQEEVLTLSKPAAERIYMGKTVGRHESRQSEIHEILLQKSREGKTVVRLKGGDPFVFGRGGEEAEFLAEHGVPFEVVPGVSSALAAPASAGIAITHRDAGSTVAIVTGHEANREHSRINWDALAGIDTLVFLMSVSTARRIAQELTDRGRSPETPAAMIQMAFWHGEQVVTGTLATIADDIERAGVVPPATLVVGEVVRLREILKHSQRDLLRRPDDSSSFQPAPAPDQLFRLATGGIGSQVLRLALTVSLFDHLETWNSAGQLASLLQFDRDALAELLECLTAMGLIEAGCQGFRNLELASRYLTSGSLHTLRPALLYQVALADPGAALDRYLRQGSRDRLEGQPDPLYGEACECLARFSAPAVIEKVNLDGARGVGVAGWGASAYREAIARRWPGLRVDAVNPFENGRRGEILSSFPSGLDALLLCGLLASCDRGQVQRLLEDAARRIPLNGILCLHDFFLPDCAVPPPEITLAELSRRVFRGGCRNWGFVRLRASLEQLGFTKVDEQRLPAGSLLVSARRH
jgi:uroporphyrin-III C-methyltransferase